jgi:SAM-dependent methyltransferase
MPLTLQDWHTRYQQQARWTHAMRQALFQRAGFDSARLILDVGCGTGALADEFPPASWPIYFGLDISFDPLRFARQNTKQAKFNQADAHELPFPEGTFDITFCHYLLLWASSPEIVMCEMVRVTRKGGWVCALAEPDHLGRIDHPPELRKMGELQTESLMDQGAAVDLGRRLPGLFRQSGLSEVEAGLLGAQWSRTPSSIEIEAEWQIFSADLEKITQITTEGIRPEELRQLDEQAWQRDERVLFVPTFYALGRVL